MLAFAIETGAGSTYLQQAMKPGRIIKAKDK